MPSCKSCGGEFKRRSGKQSFCSRACREAPDPVRKCGSCAGPIKRWHIAYCSLRCSAKVTSPAAAAKGAAAKRLKLEDPAYRIAYRAKAGGKVSAAMKAHWADPEKRARHVQAYKDAWVRRREEGNDWTTNALVLDDDAVRAIAASDRTSRQLSEDLGVNIHTVIHARYLRAKKLKDPS